MKQGLLSEVSEAAVLFKSYPLRAVQPGLHDKRPGNITELECLLTDKQVTLTKRDSGDEVRVSLLSSRLKIGSFRVRGGFLALAFGTVY